MKKKVLGSMLLLLIGLLLLGCAGRVTASASGSITFELHDGTSVVATETVLFYEGDTLLGLLQDTFEVACADANNQLDETCSYVGPYGVYLLKVGAILTDPTKNEYVAFYINGEYAMTGIDSTDIVNGTVYQFRYESY
jgi:hypothetical protein